MNLNLTIGSTNYMSKIDNLKMIVKTAVNIRQIILDAKKAAILQQNAPRKTFLQRLGQALKYIFASAEIKNALTDIVQIVQNLDEIRDEITNLSLEELQELKEVCSPLLSENNLNGLFLMLEGLSEFLPTDKI